MSTYQHTEKVHNMEGPRALVPLLMKLVAPSSVLDVGSGIGTWLKAFEEQGISDYKGVDGDYADRSLFKIPLEKFNAQDLRSDWSLHRTFDLVLCLEVAEHLPEDRADHLVKTLIAHGDTILFSAAIPGQGGQFHLNEQWPNYWQEIFARYGYYFYDELRPLIWDNIKIEWWYRQNIFIVRKRVPDKELIIQQIVHPGLLAEANDLHHRHVSEIVEGKQGLNLAFRILVNSIRFKLKNL